MSEPLVGLPSSHIVIRAFLIGCLIGLILSLVLL